ncbi:ExeA family protein [Ghiorsea bivora]|uniref:ExeA family protein n=1 Tax=Ghiorsea bivora TaxID=1485545 RepID=UPI0005716883|nr:ExeA family protein [Ghiorsea bivora]
MYTTYFGFTEKPFTIAPNPKYLFMSARHKEALAHMLYGLQGEGGVMVLTGEVGTGKTTICKHLLEQIPEHTDIAYIINPKQSETEILASLCDELHIRCADTHSIKSLTDALNQYLLEAYSKGRHTVLIIDEAQNLEISVLEQLRLLTNLETNDKKLLKIMLLGQPELVDILNRKDLRQLAQRVTSRYHLTPLHKDELVAYVHHRLSIAGANNQELFPKPVLDLLFEYSGGIPRLINLIADRALLGTYASENKHVDKNILQQARNEVLGETTPVTASATRQSALPYILFLAAAITLLWVWNASNTSTPLNTITVATQTSRPVQTTPKPATTKKETRLAITPEQTIEVNQPEVTGVEVIQATEPQHLPSTTNFNQAFVPLFQAWNIVYKPTSDADPCTFAKQHQLQCLRQLGDIAAMRSLDKPAVLSISDEDGLKAYTAVLKLVGAKAMLATQDVYAEVPLTTLALFSHNDFTLLWKAPKDYNAPVRPGHSGALVATLAEQITQALNQSWIGAPRTQYDNTLKEQVKTLQRQEGLSPDGIAGPLTWIHINALNHIDAPSLHATKESN